MEPTKSWPLYSRRTTTMVESSFSQRLKRRPISGAKTETSVRRGAPDAGVRQCVNLAVSALGSAVQRNVRALSHRRISSDQIPGCVENGKTFVVAARDSASRVTLERRSLPHQPGARAQLLRAIWCPCPTAMRLNVDGHGIIGILDEMCASCDSQNFSTNSYVLV